MKKTMDIYEKRGIKTVWVTSGRNGYPLDERKYAVFDTQTETEDYARRIDGTAVLLRKRDGWEFYEEVGYTSLPRRFSAEDFGAYEDTFVYEMRSEGDLDDALTEENALRESEGLEPVSASKTLCEAVFKMHDGDLVVAQVHEEELCDICEFRAEDTSWHDSDVWHYQIAVCGSPYGDIENLPSVEELHDVLSEAAQEDGVSDAFLDCISWLHENRPAATKALILGEYAAYRSDPLIIGGLCQCLQCIYKAEEDDEYYQILEAGINANDAYCQESAIRLCDDWGNDRCIDLLTSRLTPCDRDIANLAEEVLENLR